ncbi:MAG: hypothetical protein HY460_01460 [Parcubacteria group bacterium]|nr:hypothetical protein [Parcubacteria group bacterium]
MNERQSKIFRLVVTEFIRSAEPVSSDAIARRVHFAYSPATIRAELAELDEEGFLTQPHTSAGRMPTDRGYRRYVDSLLYDGEDEVAEPGQHEIVDRLGEISDFTWQAAHLLSELTHHLAVVSISDEEESHGAGLSELLREPEFEDAHLIRAAARIFEELDDRATEILPRIAHEDTSVYIGEENPLGGDQMSLVVSQFLFDGRHGTAALLGPKRMPYSRNIALLKEMSEFCRDRHTV